MAYTFEEAQQAIQAAEKQHPGKVAYSRGTVVITQNDSRTAWGRGNLYPYAKNKLGNLGHVSDPNFIFLMRFSDRNLFAGNADLVGLDIVKVSAGNYRADFVLYSWGGVKYSVDLKPAGQAATKLMIGYGNTIGFLPAAAAALYSVSIQDIVVTENVPL